MDIKQAVGPEIILKGVKYLLMESEKDGLSPVSKALRICARDIQRIINLTGNKKDATKAATATNIIDLLKVLNDKAKK